MRGSVLTILMDSSRASSARNRFRRSVCLAFLAAWLSPFAVGYAQQTVSIELVGEIDVECQLTAMPTNVELGQLNSTGSVTIPFILNCNTPFSYRVSAVEGGLKYSGPEQLAPGFSGSIPYDLEVNIPTDAGEISDSCSSGSLVGASPTCHFSTSGIGIAVNQHSSLNLSWLTDSALAAGNYREVLTFTVLPQF